MSDPILESFLSKNPSRADTLQMIHDNRAKAKALHELRAKCHRAAVTGFKVSQPETVNRRMRPAQVSTLLDVAIQKMAAKAPTVTELLCRQPDFSTAIGRAAGEFVEPIRPRVPTKNRELACRLMIRRLKESGQKISARILAKKLGISKTDVARLAPYRRWISRDSRSVHATAALSAYHMEDEDVAQQAALRRLLREKAAEKAAKRRAKLRKSAR